MDYSLKEPVCKLGVWDSTIPGIEFDDNGVSNYARIQQRLMSDFPRGKKGKESWDNIISKVKKQGARKDYDCIVGVSGGVDSSYLLYLLKEVYGLRPLAVNFDNGWSSDIAVQNIRKVTEKLDIDLVTYVVDYEVIKDLQKSFMRASLPWIDTPTDLAIKSTMYKTAKKYSVKYIFRGNDFRSEGKQPKEWTSSDLKQLKYVHEKFGELDKLSNYPKLSFWQIVSSGFIHGIKDIRPFYFIEYDKASAKKFLKEEFDWEYYGGHHHENLFTKFAMSVWLPKKFGIDKRKVTLSAQVLSGDLKSESALERLKTAPLAEEDENYLISYVKNKLELSDNEYLKIWSRDNKYYYDYPSNISLIKTVNRYLMSLVGLIYPIKPMSFYEIQERNK